MDRQLLLGEVRVRQSFQESLLALARDLDEESQRTLLAFAEFLAARSTVAGASAPKCTEPLHYEPSPDETVVGALKRLRRSYPMLNHRHLLSAAAELMTRHVVHGHDAAGVISELEALFQRHYSELSAQQSRASCGVAGDG